MSDFTEILNRTNKRLDEEVIESQRQQIERLTQERDAARANFLKARDARDAAISRAEQAEKALAESRRIR